MGTLFTSYECRLTKLYLKRKGHRDLKGSEIAVNLPRIFVEISFIYLEAVVVLTRNSQSFGPLFLNLESFILPSDLTPVLCVRKFDLLGFRFSFCSTDMEWNFYFCKSSRRRNRIVLSRRISIQGPKNFSLKWISIFLISCLHTKSNYSISAFSAFM